MDEQIPAKRLARILPVLGIGYAVCAVALLAIEISSVVEDGPGRGGSQVVLLVLASISTVIGVGWVVYIVRGFRRLRSEGRPSGLSDPGDSAVESLDR